MDGGKRARDGDGGANGSKRHAGVSEGALATLTQLWANAADHRLRDVVSAQTPGAFHARSDIAPPQQQQSKKQQDAAAGPMIELELKCGITNPDGSFLPNVGQVRRARRLSSRVLHRLTADAGALQPRAGCAALHIHVVSVGIHAGNACACHGTH